ncbi:MAG: response regulator, partial [Verrucomicrobia bacterium]|nr:response regulator [Verrucomicrobiota bacterium]
LSGLEVLQRVRADVRTRRLPVVVLTTSDEQRDLEAAYDQGANSYIRKSIDYEHFFQAVRQIGLYWLVMNEPPPCDAAR